MEMLSTYVYLDARMQEILQFSRYRVQSMKNSGFDEKQGLTFENCCNQVPQGVEDSVVTSVLLIRTWRHGDSSTSTSPYAVGCTIDIQPNPGWKLRLPTNAVAPSRE